MYVKRKIGVYFGMLIFAAFVTGLYGVIHDQISYTISPEYFTQLKFKQFGIPWGEQFPRLGAACVGFMHNASYLGGLTGLMAGIFYLLIARRRYSQLISQKVVTSTEEV